MDSLERSPRDRSTQASERALDVTAFFLADVADGLGPFLIIDLTSRRGWSAGDAGMAMAMLLLGTVLTQTLTGAWIDRTWHKTRAISAAALSVGIMSIALYFWQSRAFVYAAQFFTGMAVTVFLPALAAVSLGLVGRNRLASRAGRNESCFHAGNVTAAGLAILANHLWGSLGIFCAVAGMSLCSAIAATFIRPGDINHDLARGADGVVEPTIVPWQTVLQDRRILWFTASVVLFHFANAAMLPLVGQKVGHQDEATAQTLMAVCIIVAQVVMVPVAILASRAAAFRRRPVFLIAFAVLPFRGWFYTLTDSPAWLIANQVLDAVGAGIFGVVAVLMIADLTHGTGRFNLVQGIIATAIGLGAAASNAGTGLVVDRFGYNGGFYFLSSVAIAALALFALSVPETNTAPAAEPVGEPALTTP